MPLLKRKSLEKVPAPEYLRDDEEVFYCEMTNEVFRDYEDFAERTILCNSMVWTCSMTGKSNLTYSEALASEEIAKKHLKDFPVELRIPVLFIASKTKRGGFGEMAEDVFSFMKDRYFVGENIEACFSGNKWREYHILQVIAPTKEETEKAPKNGNINDRHFSPPASLFKYDVESLDGEEQDVTEKMLVDYTQIRRKKGAYSRERNKLFLKQYVEQNSQGVWAIKESVLDDFGITRLRFDQIFDGPLPDFEALKKGKPINGKKVRQETLVKYLTKNGAQLPQNIELMTKRKMALKEKREAIKQQTAEQKLAEKERKKNESIQRATKIKNWYKLKEDLELEDQNKLPSFTPVQTKVPEKYFGDVLMVMEFIFSFSKLLRAKDFFPHGLTFKLMERALIEKELNGPYIDLIQMLLTALFNVQDEEASQYKTAYETNCKIELSDHMSLRSATQLATAASQYSVKHQGLPLGRLPIYALSVSEILRLHLLSSGARVNDLGARWRYQERGGYVSEDDPGLHLRIHEPHILKALTFQNVVQLSMKNKINILTCLMNQLLTYADVRDIVEERRENCRQAKIELKSMEKNEKKRKQKLPKDKLNKAPIEDIKKLDLENNEKSTDYEKDIKKLKNTYFRHQIFLGYDRALRRYIKSESIPGVFVEFNEQNPGTCMNEVIKQCPDLVNANKGKILEHLHKIKKEMNSSDKENNPEKNLSKMNGLQESHKLESEKSAELYMCSANPQNCIIHSSTVEHTWFFLHTEEQLQELINGLNIRGIRESELKLTLQNDQENILKRIKQTPTYLLNPLIVKNEEEDKPKISVKSKYDNANFGFTSETDISEIQHSILVENILELEGKIFAGSLGCLKVSDRNLWRKYLSEASYEMFLSTFPIENGEEDDNTNEIKNRSRSPTPDSNKKNQYEDPGKYLGNFVGEDSEADGDELPDISVISKCFQTLTIALVHISQAVESRYLKKPLGRMNRRRDDKKKDYEVLERWQQSLLASTSFSQIFLHYSTLDNCIMWSRSALLAKCRICHQRKDSENMLLCDNCNLGHHIYCLKPKLTGIPEGNWFCNHCLREKEKEAKVEVSENKKKRRIFIDDENEEENGEESASLAEEEEEADEEMESDFIKVEVCTTCQSGGEFVYCDQCPKMYHVECVQPPLRRAPRGKWLCNTCKDKKLQEEQDSGNEITMPSRRSNRREAETREDLPLHNAALHELLSDIMKHKDAWPFIRPVQKNEVPDYYEIIEKPMDFGTIKYKLNMGEYKCDSDLMADAVLVFENCNTYNNSDADVYKCGVILLKHFGSKCKELGLKLPEELLDDEDELIEPNPKKRRIN